METIVLCSNPAKDTGYALTMTVYAHLKARGFKPLLCPFGGRKNAPLPSEAETAPIEKAVLGAKLVITFGGDGTILHAARAAAPAGVAVLGVNFGKKGFMTELDPQSIGLVDKALDGQYELDRRMMLDVSVLRGGEEIYRDFALNDAVVEGMAREIPVTVYGDGRRITSYDGDGIIAATPTGSTAYSLAAGGPIVEPEAENILLTPVCAHMLAARSFVLAPERRVEVELGHLGSKQAYLSCDGGASVPLKGGDRVCIARSSVTASFLHLTDVRFYDKISEKLGERT